MPNVTLTRVRYKVGTRDSGHHGHEGRPGEVGGSLRSGQYGGEEYEERRARQREALQRHRARVRAARAQQQQQTIPQPVVSYNIIDIFSKLPPVITDRQVFIPAHIKQRLAAEGIFIKDVELLKRFAYTEGYKADVSVTLEGDSAHVGISWEDANGHTVASQNISLRGYNKSVYFDYLRVNDDIQAQDFAMPLVIKQIAMLKMAGAESATMNADISIGKYAWAKEGAEYKNAYLNYTERAVQQFERWSGWMQEQYHIDVTGGDTSWRTFTHPYQWAKYKTPGVQISHNLLQNGDVRPGSYEVGKAFMLAGNGHGDWDAIIDLTKLTV